MTQSLVHVLVNCIDASWSLYLLRSTRYPISKFHKKKKKLSSGKQLLRQRGEVSTQQLAGNVACRRHLADPSALVLNDGRMLLDAFRPNE